MNSLQKYSLLFSIAVASTLSAKTINLDYGSFGAIPDDGKNDSPALQRAFDALMENGGGTLTIPSGSFDIKERVIAKGDFDKIRIEGSGHSLSRLICHNTDGILKITATNADAIIEIVDLDLPPSITDAGTALELSKPYSAPDDLNHNLLLSNLELRPEDLNADYFTHVFKLDGWKALLDSINTSGLYGPNFNTFEGKRKKYVANSIVTLSNAYQPRIRFCNLWAAEYGIVIELTDAHFEPTINGTVSVENAHGIHITKIGDKPQSNPVWIDGSHWNNAFTGLILTNVDGFKITKNCVYGAWDLEEDLVDIKLVNSSNGIIANNSFWFAVKPRIACVYVDAGCENVLIENLHFGQGVSTEPVFIEKGAKDIVVRNNVYGTVYAMDENDTFALWEFEKVEGSLALDKDILHPGRDNDLRLSNVRIEPRFERMRLGQALGLPGPDSTAVSTEEWPGSPGIRINAHLFIEPGLDYVESTILRIPEVLRLYIKGNDLFFTFMDDRDEPVTLRIPNVASRRDGFAILAEVDPRRNRAVLEASGSGRDEILSDQVGLASGKAQVEIGPVDDTHKFRGALDQIWIQKIID